MGQCLGTKLAKAFTKDIYVAADHSTAVCEAMVKTGNRSCKDTAIPFLGLMTLQAAKDLALDPAIESSDRQLSHYHRDRSNLIYW